MSKKSGWKASGTIAAMSIVFIGFVALVIGVYQAKIAPGQRAVSANQ